MSSVTGRLLAMRASLALLLDLKLLAAREAQVRDVGGEEHAPGPFDIDAQLAAQGGHLRQVVGAPQQPRRQQAILVVQHRHAQLVARYARIETADAGQAVDQLAGHLDAGETTADDDEVLWSTPYGLRPPPSRGRHRGTGKAGSAVSAWVTWVRLN